MIRFEFEDGIVSGMTIDDETGTHIAPKVALYSEEDVRFDGEGAILSATLMVPTTPGQHPAVIMAHASGGGERHSFWMFASGLVQNGIAVLAYDRRGHGKSTGGEPFNLDIEILAEDMKAGYAWLQARTDIDALRIGLMGFSNGS